MELVTAASQPALKVKEPVVALLKAAAEAAFCNAAGVISNLIDAAAAMGRQEQTGAQAAHCFWKAVLAYAVMDVIGRYKIADFRSESWNTNLIAAQFGPVMEEDVAFSENCLREPTSFSPYQDLRRLFRDMIKVISPQRDFAPGELERQLDVSLQEGIGKVWISDKSTAFREYANSVLEGPVAEGVRQRLAWQRHYSWIDHKLSKQPLFGQEETGVTLRDVYVPLRSNFHTEVPDDAEEAETAPVSRHGIIEKRMRRIANIGLLEETVKTWLSSLSAKKSNAAPADTMRLVAGPPGCGKSVFSRVLAYDVAMAGEFQVAYAELQHMRFRDDFRDRIRDYFKPNAEGAGLGGDLFDMIDFDGAKPVLFVFDGLDEISHSDDAARDVSRKFIRNVKDLLRDMNRNGFKAAAIVLGRSVSVTEAMAEAEIDLRALLHVMPLKKLDEACLYLSAWRSGELREGYDYNDPDHLVKNDDRYNYWSRSLTAFCLSDSTDNSVLEIEALEDLTSEPLLFYLLILSGYADNNAGEAALNRNLIYRQIFLKVHERDKKKEHAASRNLNKDDFLHLMECLGLSIWQGGGRTGSRQNYESYRKFHSYGKKREFEEKPFASLSNVTSQFYTRAVDDADQGFEFVHKSFGEYLAGCALLRAGRELCLKYEDPEEFCPKWLDLFCAQPVSPEILDFLKDECRLLNVAIVKKLKEDLIQHMNWVLLHGFPAHKRDNTISWAKAEAWQRNATGALLSLLSALAQSLSCCPEVEKDTEGSVSDSDRPNVIQLAWPDHIASRRFIEMLHVSHDRSTAHHLVMSNIDFSLLGSMISNFEYLNLNNVNFNGSDLRYALFSGSDLTFVDMSQASLRFSHLNSVNLMKSDLYNSDFYGAVMFKCNFMEVNLTKANLNKSILNVSRLRRACLLEANLTEASLHYADLTGANLHGAKFTGADFDGATLDRALLIAADLSESKNVDQQQIDSAFGDATTLLPADLKRPSHWPDRVLEPSEIYEEWNTWRATMSSE
ncbi:pentapeptide repeat-containing protein [Pannonibacter phragmitetus]|uniref:pentapeptide repeat-containing protein n=1 Tax=Pannonibacter phragmitetus TaxID=121719 RepID=UPI000B962AA5|nr:pentapeptide repeat-containing protein [Pannonibacter phragmitetus]